jgi:flagellar hook-associated protein 3 FlgL
MRVGDRLKYDLFKSNLSSMKERLDKTQEMIASGKKVLSPSDDPVIAAKTLQLEAGQQLGEQFRRNLDRIKTMTGMYETSLTSVNDLLTRAKEIGLTQGSDTMDASDRKMASEEVKGIIEQLVALGNTKLGNTYVFGGTKSNTAPFVLNEADYSVTFQGSDEVPLVFVDRGETEKMGMSGKDVFYEDGGVDVFAVLQDLEVALETNDVDSIRGAMADIDDALALTETNIGYIGTYDGKIGTLIEGNEARTTKTTEIISDMSDVDIADLITEYNSLSNAYETMLYTMAKVQNLNILNFLR